MALSGSVGSLAKRQRGIAHLTKSKRKTALRRHSCLCVCPVRREEDQRECLALVEVAAIGAARPIRSCGDGCDANCRHRWRTPCSSWSFMPNRIGRPKNKAPVCWVENIAQELGLCDINAVSHNSDQTLILVRPEGGVKIGAALFPPRSAARISPSPVTVPEIGANISTMNCDHQWTQEGHFRIIAACVSVATPTREWLSPVAELAPSDFLCNSAEHVRHHGHSRTAASTERVRSGRIVVAQPNFVFGVSPRPMP